MTSHGAAALETALGELPAVLVAQLDLPLIDGPQLAAILRANPRTQPTRMLFVSERAEAAARKDLPGRLIAAPVDPDEVARRRARAARRARRRRAPAHEADRRRRHRRGRPRADRARRSAPAVPREPRDGNLRGDARARAGPAGARRDRAARRRRDRARASIRRSGEKALYRLLAWDRGRFTFRPGPVDRDRHDPAPDARAAARGQAPRRGVRAPGGRAAAALRPRDAARSSARRCRT